MSTQDTTPLLMLLEREQQTRDDAALALQRAQDQKARVDAQASMFRQHRADYVARWQGEFQRSGGIEIVQCYRSFITRLDQAMGQIDAQQRQSAAMVERCRTRLVQAQTRVAAIEALIERRHQAQALTERRREQKQTDEMAQRSAWLARQVMGAPALG
jgi:flagellar FliJ protein